MAPDDISDTRARYLDRLAQLPGLLAASRARYGTARMEDKPDDKGGKPDEKPDEKPDDTEPTPEELAALGDKGQRALERLRAERDRLREEHKAAAEKAAKYDELENAKLSEAERLAADKDAADKRASKAEHDLAKLQAVLAVGLPASAASRISGDTPAKLKADAEAYKAELDEVAAGRKRRTTSDADKGGDGPTGGMSGLIRQRAGRTS